MGSNAGSPKYVSVPQMTDAIGTPPQVHSSLITHLNFIIINRRSSRGPLDSKSSIYYRLAYHTKLTPRIIRFSICCIAHRDASVTTEPKRIKCLVLGRLDSEKVLLLYARWRIVQPNNMSTADYHLMDFILLFLNVLCCRCMISKSCRMI